MKTMRQRKKTITRETPTARNHLLSFCLVYCRYQSIVKRGDDASLKRRAAQNQTARSQVTPTPRQKPTSTWWRSIEKSASLHCFQTSHTSCEMKSTIRKPIVMCTAPRSQQWRPTSHAGGVQSTVAAPRAVAITAWIVDMMRSAACCFISKDNQGHAQIVSRQTPQIAEDKAMPLAVSRWSKRSTCGRLGSNGSHSSCSHPACFVSSERRNNASTLPGGFAC
mmetsp:Transcript_36763/g.80622  ORF Transcript_36763/g.80622 Transcript_36763/m.80622 type:complete len:222 (-) Transcript_36763:202-867(-)